MEARALELLRQDQPGATEADAAAVFDDAAKKALWDLEFNAHQRAIESANARIADATGRRGWDSQIRIWDQHIISVNLHTGENTHSKAYRLAVGWHTLGWTRSHRGPLDEASMRWVGHGNLGSTASFASIEQAERAAIHFKDAKFIRGKRC